MHLRWRVRHAGVAEFTILNGPGHVTVVASSAILAVDDFHHVDIVTAGFELKAEIAVAHLAAKANSAASRLARAL